MSQTNNTYHVRVQLKDTFKEVNVNDSGAIAFVCNAGTPVLATLTDQYGNALANPLQLTSGLLDFYYTAAVSTAPASVDIYGITAKGMWFEYTGVSPSGPNEINVDGSAKRMRMKIPFAIANGAVAATEFKTGFKVPAQVMIMDSFHGTGLLVTTAQSGKTINVGILSSETGGAASGFINGSSLASAYQVLGTDGSLFASDAPYLTDTGGATPNGLDVSYTLSAGTTTAQGFILLPYMMP